MLLVGLLQCWLLLLLLLLLFGTSGGDAFVLLLLVDVMFGGVCIASRMVCVSNPVHCAYLIAARYTKSRNDAKGVQIQADLVTWLESVCKPYEK